MTSFARLEIHAIADACRRHYVTRMEVVGSVLRPDYRAGESDTDLLVKFLPLDPGSLYKAYFALLNDLRLSLASQVDLVMADAVRDDVLALLLALNANRYADEVA